MQISGSLLHRLSTQTTTLDQSGEWPREQLGWLAEEGIPGWVIPKIYGGAEISQQDLIQGYQQLAAACQTTAFVMTQRNGACQRIAGCRNEELKSELLPLLAQGKIFATVGISHLTTSRQHLKTPAVSAELRGDDIQLHGSIPWVTGAEHAQYIVTGGTCSDGRQVLIALPTDRPGVTVQPSAQLLAYTASRTATVGLDHVMLPSRLLLAGPVAEVMKQGQGGGTGSQVTSTLAIGLSERMLRLLREQAKLRPELLPIVQSFSEELDQLTQALYLSVNTTPGDEEALNTVPQTAAEIRQRANSLVTRITQSAMVTSKGAGFVTGHPAELAVREAMFFLVWSCPQPVSQGMLHQLMSPCEL